MSNKSNKVLNGAALSWWKTMIVPCDLLHIWKPRKAVVGSSLLRRSRHG
jgi:hypothetical protein